MSSPALRLFGYIPWGKHANARIPPESMERRNSLCASRTLRVFAVGAMRSSRHEPYRFAQFGQRLVTVSAQDAVLTAAVHVLQVAAPHARQARAQRVRFVARIDDGMCQPTADD